MGKEFSDAEDIKYIIFTSDTPNVCGYTKFYHEGLYRVAVPAVQSINTEDIYVPHIDSSTKWWTGIALVNTTDAKKTLNINFNTGETKQISLTAGEHTQFNIKDLFGGVSQPNLESAEISPGAGIIGLELFSAGNTLSGVLLKDDAADTLYFPHVVSNDKWWTGIAFVNASDTSADVALIMYDNDGFKVAEENMTLAAYEKIVDNPEDIFSGSITAGRYLQFSSDKDVVGFQLNGSDDGMMLDGLPGM